MRRRQFIKSLLGSALLWKPSVLLAGQGSPSAPAPDLAVKRVLVMFKCHFDAGFADTQAAVVHRYFTEYFPQAMDLASEIVKQLPHYGREREYRIKTAHEEYVRSAVESQLSPV